MEMHQKQGKERAELAACSLIFIHCLSYMVSTESDKKKKKRRRRGCQYNTDRRNNQFNPCCFVFFLWSFDSSLPFVFPNNHIYIIHIYNLINYYNILIKPKTTNNTSLSLSSTLSTYCNTINSNPHTTSNFNIHLLVP